MNQGTVNLMTQKKCINSAFDTRIIINNRKKKIDIIGYNSTVNTKSEHVTTKTRKNSDQYICEQRWELHVEEAITQMKLS